MRRFRRILVALLSVFVIAASPSSAQSTPSDPLFDGSVLHDIQIRINTADWQTLKDRFMENTYYPCDMQWRDLTVRNVGVRSRGTGSRSGTKPHLGIDFGRYVTGQTFLGLKAVVLRNDIQDPAFGMRERIGLQLFRRLGIPASRAAHARLFINGTYAGLYMLVEPLDTVFLRRAFGTDDGYLFSFSSPPEGYRFEYRGDDPAQYVPGMFKPETHTSDPQPDAIVRLVSTVNLTPDAAFRSAIETVLDVDEFLKHIAIDTFLGEDDSILGNWGLSNAYWYRPADSPRFSVVPWDKSNAFAEGPSWPIWQNTDVNHLSARLLAYDDLRARYLQYLTEAGASCTCIEDGSTMSARTFIRRPSVRGPGWMEMEVAGEYDQIKAAAYSDPVSPYTMAQFETEVANLRAFARARVAYVNAAIASSPPPFPTRPYDAVAAPRPAAGPETSAPAPADVRSRRFPE